MTLPSHRIVILGGIGLSIGLGLWIVRGYDTEPIDSYAQCAEAGYRIEDTNPPACKVGNRTLLGPKAAPAPSLPASTAQNFEILVQGDSRGAYPNRQEVVSTLPDFVRYWQAVHASLPQQPPIIPVDFKLYDVVALSEGIKNTNGYNLKVTAVTTSAAGSVISATESIPTITCPVTTAPTNRYFIVKTAKLIQPVSFRVATSYRHCDPS